MFGVKRYEVMGIPSFMSTHHFCIDEDSEHNAFVQCHRVMGKLASYGRSKIARVHAEFLSSRAHRIRIFRIKACTLGVGWVDKGILCFRGETIQNPTRTS